MAKQSFPQQVYLHTLKQKVVRDLRIVTEVVGTLTVIYTGYFDPNASPVDVFDRYCVDVDFVMWNEVDIRPVLEATGQLEDIEEETIRAFADQCANIKAA